MELEAKRALLLMNWTLQCTKCSRKYSNEHYKEGDPCLCTQGVMRTMEKNVEEELHSILGASSSKRWMACPGSVNLCKDIPSTTSKYAEEGTNAHALGEHCLINKFDDVTKFVGLPIPGAQEADGVATEPAFASEEMCNAVQVYVETVLNDLTDMKKAKLEIEHKFDLKHVLDGMFGTADAVVYNKDLVRVYDLKYGAGVFVSIENNTQAMYYALGAVHELAPKAKEVEMVIVQPRCSIGEPVRRWRISVKELYVWRDKELLPAAVEAMKPGALLVAGDHCKSTFCPAMAQCPKLADMSYEMAKKEFGAD